MRNHLFQQQEMSSSPIRSYFKVFPLEKAEYWGRIKMTFYFWFLLLGESYYEVLHS